MSVSHLQKLFKQIYGVPVYHYIKEYRLEQAAVELVRSARPVTEIAQDAGYDNASKFARAFRDVIGVSPREYRAGAEYDSCAPRLGEKPVSLSDADVERRI